MNKITEFPAGHAAGWLALGVFVSVVSLSWLGYYAIHEWRLSAQLLAERRSSEAANLLVEALTRDMRGAQHSVLGSVQWHQFASDRPYEMSGLVASAFARYPYPDSFFAWRGGESDDRLVFFTRADRRPSWASASRAPRKFPVVIEHEASIATTILGPIRQNAEQGHTMSVFQTSIGGTPYQVVAQLFYLDPFREQFVEVVGFTVNLPWVRAHYFADLTTQVREIGGGTKSGMALSVTDSTGQQVAGAPMLHDATLNQRQFALAFFDADTVLNVPNDLRRDLWTVKVSTASDPALSRAIAGANRTAVICAVSALVMAIGLVLTVRAERASAALAAIRSDFVSAVTHELKTPLATIHAAAETLSQGRLKRFDEFHAYGRLVVGESKRLSRLVENLLAYSRITDVADAYAFGRLDVEVLMKDLQQAFETQLDEAGFNLQFNLSDHIKPLHGDRLALRLLFENLIDNAVRYSAHNRDVIMNASSNGDEVVIDVQDFGIGIPEEELSAVTRKFVRGRNAPSGGSGLGLAIASRIAHDHGGSLTILSTVGEGTTVTVRLQAMSLRSNSFADRDA